MQNRSIIFRGSRIRYAIYGQGKPVVLIHGFGEDSSVWNEQVDFLKDKFQLIIPDLPAVAYQKCYSLQMTGNMCRSAIMQDR